MLITDAFLNLPNKQYGLLPVVFVPQDTDFKQTDLVQGQLNVVTKILK